MLRVAPVQDPVRQPQPALKSWPAPTAGWVANRNLAQPNEQGVPQGAAVLDNFFPTTTTCVLRRGRQLYATLGEGDLPVLSMFTYIVGNQQQMFAATDEAIYNITTVSSAVNYTLGDDLGQELETEGGDTLGQLSTQDMEVFEGTTHGGWIVVQFATTGGTYLVGVNGEDIGFIYDGGGFYPNVEGGVSALSYTGGTQDFEAGETVTGGTSGATAVILEVIESAPGEGALLLTDVTDDFEAGEALTGSEGGAATSASVDTLVVPGVEFPGLETLTTANLSFVWAYKNRLFFIQKDSLDVWYLPVDQIGGELTKFPLGGVFERGGSLLFGATWSLDSGAQGGLSEQCIFVTTEGEVAVFQGADPSDANEWSRVGVYRIGRPMGKKAFIRAGSDIIIATSIGFLPLSQAIRRDVAALAPAAVSYPIEDAWNEAARVRGMQNWVCDIWPEAQMVVVAPPAGSKTDMFIANARTGAWCRFTNWVALSSVVFQGQLYLGGVDGQIHTANITGMDDNDTYTGVYLPLFDDLGSPMSLKVGRMARAAARARARARERVALASDFNLDTPAPPDAVSAGSGSEWGVAIWGQSTWGEVDSPIMNQNWRSIGGHGYALSCSLQVTSGSVVPLDYEIIRVDMTYQLAGPVT